MSGSTNTIDCIKKNFRDFYYDELAALEFDSWLCNVTELEDIVGSEVFFSLVDLDYSKRDDIESAKKIIEASYNSILKSDVSRDRVRDVLQAILSEKISQQQGCHIIWTMSLQGVNFIPAVFAGYATELKNPEMESFYHDRVIEDVKSLLKTLSA